VTQNADVAVKRASIKAISKPPVLIGSQRINPPSRIGIINQIISLIDGGAFAKNGISSLLSSP
jgi:hypothetical protein